MPSPRHSGRHRRSSAAAEMARTLPNIQEEREEDEIILPSIESDDMDQSSMYQATLATSMAGGFLGNHELVGRLDFVPDQFKTRAEHERQAKRRLAAKKQLEAQQSADKAAAEAEARDEEEASSLAANTLAVSANGGVYNHAPQHTMRGLSSYYYDHVPVYGMEDQDLYSAPQDGVHAHESLGLEARALSTHVGVGTIGGRANSSFTEAGPSGQNSSYRSQHNVDHHSNGRHQGGYHIGGAYLGDNDHGNTADGGNLHGADNHESTCHGGNLYGATDGREVNGNRSTQLAPIGSEVANYRRALAQAAAESQADITYGHSGQSTVGASAQDNGELELDQSDIVTGGVITQQTHGESVYEHTPSETNTVAGGASLLLQEGFRSIPVDIRDASREESSEQPHYHLPSSSAAWSLPNDDARHLPAFDSGQTEAAAAAMMLPASMRIGVAAVPHSLYQTQTPHAEEAGQDLPTSVYPHPEQHAQNGYRAGQAGQVGYYNTTQGVHGFEQQHSNNAVHNHPTAWVPTADNYLARADTSVNTGTLPTRLSHHQGYYSSAVEYNMGLQGHNLHEMSDRIVTPQQLQTLNPPWMPESNSDPELGALLRAVERHHRSTVPVTTRMAGRNPTLYASGSPARPSYRPHNAGGLIDPFLQESDFPASRFYDGTQEAPLPYTVENGTIEPSLFSSSMMELDNQLDNSDMPSATAGQFPTSSERSTIMVSPSNDHTGRMTEHTTGPSHQAGQPITAQERILLWRRDVRGPSADIALVEQALPSHVRANTLPPELDGLGAGTAEGEEEDQSRPVSPSFSTATTLVGSWPSSATSTTLVAGVHGEPALPAPLPRVREQLQPVDWLAYYDQLQRVRLPAPSFLRLGRVLGHRPSGLSSDPSSHVFCNARPVVEKTSQQANISFFSPLFTGLGERVGPRTQRLRRRRRLSRRRAARRSPASGCHHLVALWWQADRRIQGAGWAAGSSRPFDTLHLTLCIFSSAVGCRKRQKTQKHGQNDKK